MPFGGAKQAQDSLQEADNDKAFTLVFTGNSAVHLVAEGNGRSRDEWVAAFQDLANGCYKEMLDPDGKAPDQDGA